MILYLLKSGLCLALLLAFYHLVLEREKMHRFNRFYLLGSVLFSFLAPAFIIYVEASNNSRQLVTYAEKAVTINQNFFDQFITLENMLITIYVLGSLVFLIRFIKNLYHIIHKIRTNEIIKSDFAKIVPVPDAILPHTFWNYIFINKGEYQSQKIEEELFTHELAHVTQRHTIDVLLLEVLQIAFWFNPLFFLLKKAVQLNHEFLADDKVIASHNNISRYQSLLLNKAAWKNDYYLASNLNYSLTKKRLLMMKTTNSRTNIFLKKLAIIPLLTGLVFLFANRVEAQTTKKKPQVIEVKQVQKGITKAKMIEYQDFMKGVSKNSILKLKDVKKMRALYNKMSKAQKKTVTNIYEFLPPPPPPRKLKEIKSKKVPKPVKIEVIKKENLRKELEEKEIEIREIKEVEVIEIIEEEIPEIIEEEVEDVEEIVEQEIVDIDKVSELTNTEILKLSAKKFKGKLTYYLNGRKISEKKAKKLDTKKIKKMDIVKGKNGDKKVYYYTK